MYSAYENISENHLLIIFKCVNIFVKMPLRKITCVEANKFVSTIFLTKLISYSW